METAELIQQARQGDQAAMSRLLLAHRGLVAAVVARFVWRREQSRDVVQNIFVRAIRGMAGFKGSCRFSTWLYRIALNECMETNARQSRQSHQTVDTVEVFRDPNASDGLTELSEAELRGAIRQAVGQLPLDQRTAFCLYYFEGFSGREAAKSMRINEPNFFMKLKAARDKVRTRLRQGGWRL